MRELKKLFHAIPQLFANPDVSELKQARAELDQKLMTEVKAGKQAAFKSLFDNYKGPIMGYLVQMVQNPGLAEELTQETFLKVYRSRESYEPRLLFSAWLWTIARNTALDYLRQQKTAPSIENGVEFEDGSGSSPLEKIADPTGSAEAMLIEKASLEELEKCLGTLTVPQRDALSLRTLSELSYDEIAVELKLTVSSVKSLINRAKGALVRCIARCSGDQNG